MFLAGEATICWLNPICGLAGSSQWHLPGEYQTVAWRAKKVVFDMGKSWDTAGKSMTIIGKCWKIIGKCWKMNEHPL